MVREFELNVHEAIYGLTVLHLPLREDPEGPGLPLDITSCKLGLLQIRGASWLVLEVAPRVCFVFLCGVFWKTWCRINVVSSLRGWKLHCFNFSRKPRFPAPLEAAGCLVSPAVCPWGRKRGWLELSSFMPSVLFFIYTFE